MEMIKISSPKQIRLIYQILKDGVSEDLNDSEILGYANTLNDLFNDDFEDGYEYKPFHDEQNIKDTYSLICSERCELLYQERDLLKSVYEYESDEFITNKPWKSYAEAL